MAFANDTVRVTNSDDFDFDYLSTGQDYFWDFSSLTGTSQEVLSYKNLDDLGLLGNVVFGSFAASEYQASYHQPSTGLPLDQIGGILPVDLSEIERYTKIDENYLNLIGYSLTVEGNTIPFKSDTIETKYQFPLNFGDAFDSRGYSNIDLSPAFEGRFVQYVQRSVQVDGWGEILTPYGTFDAIRVHHFVSEIDSVEMEFNGFPIEVELPIPDKHIYEWWAAGEKEPILKVEYNVVGGTEIVTSVVYRDDIDIDLVASINSNKLDDIMVFPNPTNGLISISNLTVAAQFVLIDMSGRVVLDGMVKPNQNGLDLSLMDSGSYKLILKIGDSFKIDTVLKK